jgi:hypothetical protein
MSRETLRLDYNCWPGFISVFPEIRNMGLTQGPGLRGDCRDWWKSTNFRSRLEILVIGRGWNRPVYTVQFANCPRVFIFQILILAMLLLKRVLALASYIWHLGLKESSCLILARSQHEYMTMERDKQKTMTPTEKFNSNGTNHHSLEWEPIDISAILITLWKTNIPTYTTGANSINTFDQSCVYKA